MFLERTPCERVRRGHVYRRVMVFEIVLSTMFRACILECRRLLAFYYLTGWQQNHLAAYRPSPNLFSCHISFQRPKEHVSVGALDEIKPDVEVLGQLDQVLDFISSR